MVALLGLLLCRWRPRWGHVLIAFNLVALIVLSVPGVANLLIRGLEHYGPVSIANGSPAAAIVVLGGGVYSQAPEYGNTDTVGQTSLSRTRYAAYLQRQTGLPILVTGGAPYGGSSEAQVMRLLLEKEFFVPVQWEEDKSRDTAENAEFSGRILAAAGISKILLVTDAWHMPRAKLEFEKAGMIVQPAPTGFNTDSSGFDLWLPNASALGKSSTACREWLGLLRTQLFKN